MMNLKRIICTVDTHTAGEPTRVVTGGIPHIPGSSMQQKKEWMSNHEDGLRKMLMWEPRGHKDMFGAILTAPVSSDADMGIIYMDSGGYLDMCVHGSIGAVTAMVETGIIASVNRDGGGAQEIILDTPAGKIHSHVNFDNGCVKSVTIRNVPSFFYETLEVNLEKIDPFPVSVCYAGNYFAIVNIKHLNTAIEPGNIDKLIKYGIAIRKMVNSSLKILHPETAASGKVSLVEFFEETLPPRNVVIFGSGQADRSPCGTGTCAKMALLHYQQKLGVGEPYLYRSIIGTEFVGEILGESSVGGRLAIIPAVTGRAHIVGLQQFIVDKEDPFKNGFDLLQEA